MKETLLIIFSNLSAAALILMFVILWHTSIKIQNSKVGVDITKEVKQMLGVGICWILTLIGSVVINDLEM